MNICSSVKTIFVSIVYNANVYYAKFKCIVQLMLTEVNIMSTGSALIFFLYSFQFSHKMI